MPYRADQTPSSDIQGFRTLEVSASVSYDPVALGRILSRETSGDGQQRMHVYGPSGEADNGEWVRYRWQVWWQPPEFWRDETTWPNGEKTVIIVRDKAALAYVSMQSALYTTEPIASSTELRARPPAGTHLPTMSERRQEFPLTASRFPDSNWNLTTLGQESYNGRTARHVRALRVNRGGHLPASGYWPGVDEYELVVDDALQILLSVTGLENGEMVAAVSADAVHVDGPILADVFSFAPPPGTHVAHLSRGEK